MPLTAVTLELPPEQADLLGDALLEAGALAVDVSDAHAGTPAEQAIFDEPGHWDDAPRPIRWSHARLSALFGDPASAQRILSEGLAGLAIAPATPWSVVTVPDEDWVALTQREFVPMRVTAGLWIVPSWHEPPDPSAISLRIDPGRAFGSGSHPTTRLCLRFLAERVRPGFRVLDYGCGSGVLAIGAARLGAAQALGVDIDPEAVDTAQANARRNGVEAATAFLLPDLEPPQEHDLVVANILARPLLALAPLLGARVAPGGWLALAGLLEAQAESIAQAYAPWARLDVHALDEGWALLAGPRVG